jgi:hypothetical protein
MSVNQTRRSFLAATAATAALSLRGARLFAQGATSITVTLDPAATPLHHVPVDFIGLSYEVQQLVDPSFFSPKNTGLVRAFKQLTPNGVLRLGGNTSEFAWWKPTPSTPEPKHPVTRVVEGEPPAAYYPVTAEAVRNLAAFLHATGWTCLYGINLGTNTPERAADEAAFAAKTLGSSLQYFQVGNEADLFDRHLRDPKTWGVDAYLAEWIPIAQAIAARVPEAKFGVPDISSDITWLTKIAEKWPSVTNPPKVTTLSHHYYFGGPATNPNVNIPRLMQANPKVQHNADVATAAARKMNARVRMTEGNTCYRGGKPGVSDTFASALWAADYTLLLALNGYSGLNLHGGTGKSVANSVGGVLPGDTMLEKSGSTPAQIATHPHPFYTPIATFPKTSGDEYLLEPVALGMKFASAFAGAQILPLDFKPGKVNATAYFAKLPSGHFSLIVLNKDAARDLTLTIPGKHAAMKTELLSGPSLDSRETHITPGKTVKPTAAGLTLTIPKSTGIRFTTV